MKLVGIATNAIQFYYQNLIIQSNPTSSENIINKKSCQKHPLNKDEFPSVLFEITTITHRSAILTNNLDNNNKSLLIRSVFSKDKSLISLI